MSTVNTLLIERLKQLSSTLLADAMNHENVMDCRIKPVNYKRQLVGRARTISVYPGDNLYLHYGIYESEPGDILIVAGRNSTISAYLGSLMATAAEKIGIEGFIIDGLVRDRADLRKMNIQIYANGFSPKGPRKNGPGSFDLPIQCGDIVVNSNDYVIADEDGIAIIPFEKAEIFIKKAEEKLEYEKARLEKINNLNITNYNDKHLIEPSWLRENIKHY